MRQLPRTPTSVASVTSRFKPKGDDEGPFLAWAAERGNDAPLSGMPRPADASTGSHADIYGQPDQARPALNPATPPATEAAAPPGPLPGRSRRAAVLHAALLRSAAALALSQELEVLLHLLALPQHLKVEPGASADRQPLFPSGDAAAAYACAVLKGSGEFTPVWQPLLTSCKPPCLLTFFSGFKMSAKTPWPGVSLTDSCQPLSNA